MNPVRAFALGLARALQHWRLLLLWWLAGLGPALLATWPMARAADAAFGQQPGSRRIFSAPDLAALTDGWQTHASSFAEALLFIDFSLVLASLISPWLAGSLIASLRASGPLNFAELWLGGWREYGRQLRLYLLLLLLLLPAGALLILAFALAEVGVPGFARIAPILALVLALLLLASLESARVALVADTRLQAVSRAWIRGLRLCLKRPLAFLAILLASLLLAALVSLGLALAVGASEGPLLPLALAQLTVLLLAHLRLARLIALCQLLPDAHRNRPRPLDEKGPDKA